MFNHIMSIIANGGLWTIIIAVLTYLPKINKIIEAHLKAKKATARNAHELSLMRAADRITPSVMKVAQASPSDRLNEALSELTQYANSRDIYIDSALAKHVINNAIAKYNKSNGLISDAVKSVTSKDGSLKESDPND